MKESYTNFDDEESCEEIAMWTQKYFDRGISMEIGATRTGAA